MRLKDIIDLEYFIHIDDNLESKADLGFLAERDRDIYNRYSASDPTRQDLLAAWLAERKKQYLSDSDGQGQPMLPGEVFGLLYSAAVYTMILLGGFCGLFVTYSFLAYHGARPVNVALFTVLFIGLPLLFMAILFIGLAVRRSGRLFLSGRLVSFFCFSLLPGILRRIKSVSTGRTFDALEYAVDFIRMKHREYKAVFFWPFFTQTSLFAFSFSSGVLVALLFKILISDMAFGWQSTMVSAGEHVHDLVSLMALPWSWILPQDAAHPTLEQIEGSRIVLKDGIQMLSTKNLVSWWPFISMGVLFYTVIPRCLFMVGGLLAGRQVLEQFDFDHPRFAALMVRMQSPVLDIAEEKKSDPSKNETRPGKKDSSRVFADAPHTGHFKKTVLLLSRKVYGDSAVEQVCRRLRDGMSIEVSKIVPIVFDEQDDKESVCAAIQDGIENVVLLQEVWQPPIRGTLFYISRLKAQLPDPIPLRVLLTSDASGKELAVEVGDVDFEVWERAILKIGNPYICVERM